MIVIFNLLVELAVTGMFTALFLLLFTKLGLMPMMVLRFEDEDDKDKKDDLPY